MNRSTRIGPWVKIGEVDDKRRKIQRNANFERPWVKIGEVDDKRRKIQRNANFERPWVKIGEVDDKRRKIQRNANFKKREYVFLGAEFSQWTKL